MKKKLFIGLTLCGMILSIFFSYVSLHSSTSIEDKNNLQIKSTALQNIKKEKLVLDNGLSVLLIQDPEATQSAASLSVGVGSWDNPPEWPGMAHFLEHMLFQGSKKYPSDKEFMNYISDHSGVPNAYTAADKTVYTFKVAHHGFKGAIQRFSRFFIDPLFLPSGLEGELHAVDQEFKLQFSSDAWRTMYVIRETSDDEHPGSKFTCGNSQTLGKIPREEMLKFYKENYGADKMYLVVYSPQPIEEMIPFIEKEFSPVPRSIKSSHPVELPFLSEKKQLGKLIYMESLENSHGLEISILLPNDTYTNGKEWYYHFLSNLLMNKQPGSLFSVLDKKGWVFSLMPYTYSFSKNSNLFGINVILTQKGKEHLEEISKLCKQYVEYIQNAENIEPLYKEFTSLAKIGYEFQNRQDPYDFVSSASELLQKYSLDAFPSNMYQFPEFDKNLFAKICKEIVHSKTLNIYSAPKNSSSYTANCIEEFLKVPYGVYDQEDCLCESVDFALPSLNPYVPNNFNLIDKSNIGPSEQIQDESSLLTYVRETQFKTPHVYCSLNFKSPYIKNDGKNVVVIDLLNIAIEKKIQNLIDTAGKSGISLNLSQEMDALRLSITGFNAHYKKFVKDLITEIHQIQFSPEEFKSAREELLLVYDQQLQQQPFRRAFTSMKRYIDQSPSISDCISLLKQITFSDFFNTSENFLNQFYVEGMLTGNIPQSDLGELQAIIKEGLPHDPYEKKDQIAPSPLLINKPEQHYKNISQDADVTILALQTPNPTMKETAAHSVLASFLRQDFFDTLRTKQQTAYVAASVPEYKKSMLIQHFFVQSTTHSSEELLYRFELFIEEFRKDLLTNVSEDRFANAKKSILSQHSQFQNLYAFGEKVFSNLLKYGDLEHQKKSLNALDALTYQDFTAYVETFLSRQHAHRVALLYKGKDTKEMLKYSIDQ